MRTIEWNINHKWRIRKGSVLHYSKYVLFLAASCATGVIAVLLLQRIDKLIGL
jgi:hypothetical protein